MSQVETQEMICIGCPHATLVELHDLAALLQGRRVAVDCWTGWYWAGST